MRAALPLLLVLGACANLAPSDTQIANSCRDDFERCIREAGDEAPCEEQRRACVEVGTALRSDATEKERGYEEFLREREEADD